MLPKPIYESLPYMYIGGGASEIVYLDSFLANFSGVLLYLAGAMVWVLRSNYRRKDQELKRKQSATVMPENLYEFIPFIYMGAAVALLAVTSSALFYPSIALFFMAGVQTLVLRNRYRNQAETVGQEA